MEGADQEGLAEAPRTGEEVMLSAFNELEGKLSLIDLHVSRCEHIADTLYPYRELFHGFNL